MHLESFQSIIYRYICDFILQIALFALIAVSAAAPQFYAAPLYQPSYYGSPYAQPLLARYAPAPQAPASTEHAAHVAAAPLAYAAYNYVPAYAYASPAVSKLFIICSSSFRWSNSCKQRKLIPKLCNFWDVAIRSQN